METKNPAETVVDNLQGDNLDNRNEAMGDIYNVLWALLRISTLEEVINMLDEHFQIFTWDCVTYDETTLDKGVKAVLESDFSWTPEDGILYTAKKCDREKPLKTLWRKDTRDLLRTRLAEAVLAETSVIVLSDERMFCRIPTANS